MILAYIIYACSQCKIAFSLRPFKTRNGHRLPLRAVYKRGGRSQNLETYKHLAVLDFWDYPQRSENAT